MSRSRSLPRRSGRGTGAVGSPPAASVAAARWPDALGIVLAAALVLLVFHRATGYFFRADDFEGLARARGLLPERTGLARLIPWRLYFEAMDRAFGLDPRPYHLASLASLAAASGLVYAWVRPLAGRWGAGLAAAFFAAHPAHYASAYWISAIGDPLAATFALATLLAARASGRIRWLALPLFALALLSKESALLVPLVALVDRGRARELPRAHRDPLVGALALASAAMVAYYVLLDPIGTRHAGGQAYVPALGAHLGANLLTYAGWTVNVPLPTFRSISDAVEPHMFPAGAGFLLACLAGAAWRPLRERGGLAGAAFWLALLAPVLPLAHHTYRYYLTGPLAGAALLVGALASLALGGRRGPTGGGPSPVVAGAAVAVIVALLAWNGSLVTRKIEFTPFQLPGSRADGIVDRALIAGRIRDGLLESPPPDGVTLRFWSPQARQLSGLPDSVSRLGYWEQNVSASVLGGLGVRVLYPRLARVEFVPRFEPGTDSLWYAVYRPDGALRAAPAPEVERALLGTGSPPR